MTKDTMKPPRQLGLRFVTTSVALVAVTAVTADILKGTQWQLGRDEWDRFSRAVWPKPTPVQAEAVKKPPPSKTEAQDIDLAVLVAGKRGLWGRLPLALLAASRANDLQGGRAVEKLRLDEPGLRGTRTVTVFEKALFGGGVIVTGHEFKPAAARSHRSFCYGEPMGGTDGVRQWVTLAVRQGDGPVTYSALKTEQAAAFKLDVATLTAMAHSHCRFTMGGL